MKQSTKVIKAKQDSEAEGGFSRKDEAKTQALIQKIEARKGYDRCEKLAGSKIWIRNFTVQALLKAFPDEPKLWHVSRHFPQAEGEPLYVDEVMNDHELPRSLRKVEVMKKAGLRFLVLKNEMTEAEDIEALEKCGQPNKQQEMI